MKCEIMISVLDKVHVQYVPLCFITDWMHFKIAADTQFGKQQNTPEYRFLAKCLHQIFEGLIILAKWSSI